MPIWQIQIQRLPFRVVPEGDMFQRKIDDIFKDLPNVFGTAEDILIVGYYVDGKGQDDTLRRVLEI